MRGPLPHPPFFGWSQIMTASKPVGLTSTEANVWTSLFGGEELTHDPDMGQPYPEPTTDQPGGEEVWAMLFAGTCPATDGCPVEPDGTCPHEHPAWPRRRGPGLAPPPALARAGLPLSIAFNPPGTGELPMSAFFVAAATIDAAVSAFLAKEGPLSLEAATQLGCELWAMNAEAVRWLYDLDTGSDEDRQEHRANLADVAAYAWTPRLLTLAVMVKSLDCLHYQCCEGPIRNLPLHKRLAALTARYDETGVQETTEYERALGLGRRRRNSGGRA